MERSKEWVIERVRKLMALANDAGAAEGERDNALRMAHNLLAKYNLDLAEVGEKDRTEPRDVHSREYYGRPWARIASRAIARLFFCEYLYMASGDAKQTKHYFIGRESNAVTAMMMAEFVVSSIAKEGKRRNSREGTGANAWYRSFCTGAAYRLVARVNEMIRETPLEATPGTALVLASLYQQESHANLAVRDQEFPTLRKARTGKNEFRRDALDSGRQFADSIQLNRQVTGKSQGLLS